jgi:hypothetical protein
MAGIASRETGSHWAGFSFHLVTSSRVPVSLLNPEGKILIFYGSFGVTANFAMVPKFEESAKKSTRELVKWVVLASSA